MNTDRIQQIQQETAYPQSISVQQALLKVWNETVQDEVKNSVVVRSLEECKEEWALKYGKTWKDVQKDFEHGIGLSKLYSFEHVMDMVAELYRQQ